jgi:2-dehydro-3-deoxy-D-arabinonate dehydratase
MKLYKTATGIVIGVRDRAYRLLDTDWDALLMRPGLVDYVESRLKDLAPLPVPFQSLAPIGRQEVWAAGVTYYRSRTARMEESKTGGSQSFYDRVYTADRPELFFKATPHRVVGPDQPVRILSDSRWNTIGNDMSSRDIEGENPLYLPQAKVYDQCCALGPCVLLQNGPLDPSTEIHLEIRRQGATAFTGRTSLAELKRSPQSLVDYLFRERSFPHGCFLLTGTGIVPDDAFTLEHGDEVRISISGIGVLVNPVVCRGRT